MTKIRHWGRIVAINRLIIANDPLLSRQSFIERLFAPQTTASCSEAFLIENISDPLIAISLCQ
jgi:hypothetical protein